ncbi:MAG: amidohydrolase [Streptosporangiales bacterium]
MTDLHAGLDALLPDLEELYRDLHAHPELSMQETRTADTAARRLADQGWEVTTQVGSTGVVGVLRNGTGPTVVLRADMDGLPVHEETGLPYASEHTGNMHACGHDMHVSCLLGAAALFAARQDAWRGTLIVAFQPAEETSQGAQTMLDDGFLDRFPKPDVVLGQHVDNHPAGSVAVRPGVFMAAADSLRIQLFGRGGHGSRPQATVDPIVLAAAVVLRLQTIVAREVPPNETAVVTVGSLHSGTKENIIPDEAELKVNVRTFTEPVRAQVLAAIERIAEAESAAAGSPKKPEISPIHSFPLTRNAPEETERVAGVLGDLLGSEQVLRIDPKTGSEDFGRFGTAAGVPSVFWFFGGADPDAYAAAETAGRLAEDVPGNHSSRFAPVIQPTLRTGVRALVAAAGSWLVS